ncbi:MAG: type II secretion system F family protein [Acidimicrobiia bacterium]
MSALALLTGTIVLALGAAPRFASRLFTPPRRASTAAAGTVGDAVAVARELMPRTSSLVARLRVRHRVADGWHSAIELAGDLEHVARLVRSGRSLGAGLADVAAERPGSLLAAIAARRAAGASLLEAVAAEGRELSGSPGTGDDDQRLAVAVLAAVVDAGGPGGAALDRAADTIRERAAVRADRVAHAAQARLSAQILSFLPLAFTGWTTITDDRVARFLLSTPLGALCLAIGVTLDLVGWRWMHRLVAAR